MAERDLYIGITKEHVLKAISTIDAEGYPPMRRSTTYDLSYNGRAYPPKYVMSLAGYNRNEEFIHESKFSGGENSECFAYLRELGFSILPKSQTESLIQSKQNPEVKGKYFSEEDRSLIEAPEFFTKEDFLYLNKFKGQSFDKTNADMEKAYQHLSQTYLKVEYWMKTTQARLFSNGEFQVTKRPTNQANKFMEYLWAKIYPNAELKEWKLLAYTLTFSSREDFCVKIDTVGLGDNDPNRKKYIDYRGDFFASKIVKLFSADEILSNDWDYLIDKSCEAIRELQIDYEILVQILKGNSDDEFLKVLELYPLDYKIFYFNTLDSLLHTIGIRGQDNRVVYSCKQNRLVFKIGQRYAFALAKQNSRIYFDVISSNPINDESGKFDGKLEAYLTPLDTFLEVQENIDKIQVGCSSELSRTEKSGFLGGNNPFFEKAVFDHEYRNSLLKVESSSTSITMEKLNQILYGPPGTGKTYSSISLAVSIVDNKSLQVVQQQSREIVKARYEELVKSGRIVFTTFHQSLSYEDFVEGIKPSTEDNEVVYDVEDGIFKLLCLDAAFSVAVKLQSVETSKALDFSLRYDQFIDSLETTFSTNNSAVKIPTKSGGFINIESISPQGNIIVKHLDGGRTYTVSKRRLSTLAQEIDDLNEVTNINTKFRSIIGGSNSSAYWAVLSAIQNQKSNGSNNLPRGYTISDKISAVTSLRSEDYRKSNGEPYVLIIDEINRGNISQIFGELITLIEEDKRLGKKESIEATLPYSKSKFGVPPNVYIIGTMNTADRSVEALDTALRRRFSFIEMPPVYDLPELNQAIGDVVVKDLLLTINKRLEKLLSKDHLIGHSYFISVRTVQELKTVFQEKLIPLLQEYFYGDFGKIGLVLGNGFIVKTEEDNDQSLFAEFNDYDVNDLLEKSVYRIQEPSKMQDSEFISALKKLMRKND